LLQLTPLYEEAVMRRLVVLAVTLVAVFAMLAPPAMAQAPAPKVTITGFIDTLGTYSSNMSQYDSDYSHKDTQAYGRNRGRFDIIGEVGKAKAVLGLELDLYFGQTGTNRFGNLVGNGASAGFGGDGSFTDNNDLRTIIEIKWLYTEFPIPIIPVDNAFRVGGIPFGTAATDKLAVYANGDFGGATWTLNPSPAAQLNLTYAQLDEALTGGHDGFFRGDNWATIVSFGFAPFKGLSVKPMYSYLSANGPTSGSARQGRGGVDTTAAFSAGAFAVGAGGAASAPGSNFSNFTYNGPHESRHTIGIDGTFTAGPFSLQPTVLYQFGDRHNIIANPGACAPGVTCVSNSRYGALGTITKADINAWLVDVRGSFNVGPLSLGLLAMYTSGQDAKSNPFKSIKYFQPLDTDSSYMGDWGTQILSLGIDYFHQLFYNAAGVSLGQAIGYDKYGRITVGGKASYALTPAFTVGAGVSAAWTEHKVDKNSTLVTTAGLIPSDAAKGDSQYIGTELDLSATYRFAPGIAFDLAGGYLLAGDALNHKFTLGCCNGNPAQALEIRKGGVDNVAIATARVRFSF
jgi:hypothetical protein